MPVYGSDPPNITSMIIFTPTFKVKAGKRALTRTRTVAITPSKSKMYDPEDVKRICQTSTLAGLSAMHESGLSNPFRFIYMSGAGVGWDESKVPRYMLEYLRMRVQPHFPHLHRRALIESHLAGRD